MKKQYLSVYLDLPWDYILTLNVKNKVQSMNSDNTKAAVTLKRQMGKVSFMHVNFWK